MPSAESIESRREALRARVAAVSSDAGSENERRAAERILADFEKKYPAPKAQDRPRNAWDDVRAYASGEARRRQAQRAAKASAKPPKRGEWSYGNVVLDWTPLADNDTATDAAWCLFLAGKIADVWGCVAVPFETRGRTRIHVVGRREHVDEVFEAFDDPFDLYERKLSRVAKAKVPAAVAVVTHTIFHTVFPSSLSTREQADLHEQAFEALRNFQERF